MVNKLLFATALFAAGHALAAETAPRASVVEADPQVTEAPLAPETDGFLDPLRELKFNPGLDQREFERSTLQALNVYDPLESINRRVYHFNYRLDQWVLLPMVSGYQYVTPRFVRTGVTNFFNNLGDVPNLFNSVLQLKAKRSAEITARTVRWVPGSPSAICAVPTRARAVEGTASAAQPVFAHFSSRVKPLAFVP